MVSVGLEQPEIVRHVTGKFVMRVVSDDDEDAHLAIAVELAPGGHAGAELADAVGASIHRQLVRLDPEFAAYVPQERQAPRVTVHATGDAEWFPVGVKHRYSRR